VAQDPFWINRRLYSLSRKFLLRWLTHPSMSEILVSSLLDCRARERARQYCLDKITSGEASNTDNNQATAETSSSLFLLSSLSRKIINEPNSKLCCQSQRLLCLAFLSDSQTLGLWCPCAKLVKWTITMIPSQNWEIGAIHCHGRNDRTRQSDHNTDLSCQFDWNGCLSWSFICYKLQM